MKLFFREYGSGQPMIILHGLLGSSDNWLTQAKFFSSSYKVYTIDQRNHGLSPHSDQFDYQSMVDDLNEFIDDHQVSEPILIGHSMGGKTAMNFALLHPEKVGRLIVVDISPRAYNLEHYALVEGIYALLIDTFKSRSDADEALTSAVPESDVRQFLLKNLQRRAEGGFVWKINLPVIRAKLANVGVPLISDQTFSKPTLFIRGARSKYLPDSDWNKVIGIFPGAKLETIDSGHWVQAEKPQEFVSIVTQWLNG